MPIPAWLIQLAVKSAGRPVLGWLKRWAQAPVLTVGVPRESLGCPPEWADIPIRVENPSDTVTLEFPGPWRVEGTPRRGVVPCALGTVKVVGHDLQKRIKPTSFRDHAIRVQFESLEERESALRQFIRVRVKDARGIECEGWYPKKP